VAVAVMAALVVSFPSFFNSPIFFPYSITKEVPGSQKCFQPGYANGDLMCAFGE
jgi:hypothetical protein